MKFSFALTALSFVLFGCAETSVTPVSRNQIIISTSAAPYCGRSGANKVAAQMAAIETIRRGFERFIIVGSNSESNVNTLTTGPTYAYTSATANTYGNTTYGNATTTFGGPQTIFVGSNDTDLGVLLLNRGEQGYDQGIDAKAELGANWPELVANGVMTCTNS
jgi:hypothetical protein